MAPTLEDRGEIWMRSCMPSACTVFGLCAVSGKNHHHCQCHRNPGNPIAEGWKLAAVKKKKNWYKDLSSSCRNKHYSCVQVTGQSEVCILGRQWLIRGGDVDLKEHVRVFSWDWHRACGRRLLEGGRYLSGSSLREKSNLFSQTEAISNFQQSSLIFILFPLELNFSD